MTILPMFSVISHPVVSAPPPELHPSLKGRVRAEPPWRVIGIQLTCCCLQDAANGEEALKAGENKSAENAMNGLNNSQ